MFASPGIRSQDRTSSNPVSMLNAKVILLKFNDNFLKRRSARRKKTIEIEFSVGTSVCLRKDIKEYIFQKRNQFFYVRTVFSGSTI